MSANDNRAGQKISEELADVSSEQTAKLEGRRRLLKKAGLVAVPVVTTLASRPVLAWHCRTPSMWGSMAMNTQTSLAKNVDHQEGYADESWYISDWACNSVRSQASQVAPWSLLFQNGHPKITTKYDTRLHKNVLVSERTGVYCTQPSGTSSYLTVTPNGKSSFYIVLGEYKVQDFCSDAGIVCPQGATGFLSDLFLASALFEAHVIVAQLNYKLLPKLAKCFVPDSTHPSGINPGVIAQSNGYMRIGNIDWTPQMFVDYFEANWFAVANTTSQSNWSGGYSNKWENLPNSPVEMKIYDDKGPKQDRHYFTFTIFK